jgi:rhamnulokinase
VSSSTTQPGSPPLPEADSGSRARVAIDLGAESCRVSLLRWHDGQPSIELVHRQPNGPVHLNGSLRWPLDAILEGLEAGLRKAGAAAPEGIASIAVDGWAVDYVHLDGDRRALAPPFCYRDERTLATKATADGVVAPDRMFRGTGAQPLRINTAYQLLADAGREARAPWVCLPEYVLHWLGGRRVAEYSNATHTGLVDIDTGNWSAEILRALGIPEDPLPPIVATGTVLGRLQGPLEELEAFRETELIAPACHDTASAIAGIPIDLGSAAYICSGTWSLVGSLVENPITSSTAMQAGFTNQGAASGGFCFHTNVNGMWILKQCLEHWRSVNRPWDLEALIQQAGLSPAIPGIIPVDAPPLLLDGDMPARINEQLQLASLPEIEDRAGNEPRFARLIFESLASRYAEALRSLEELLDRKLTRIHVLGGGSRNQLLSQLTAQSTGLPVENGEPESSTIGNFAVQLASSEAGGGPLDRAAVRKWAQLLCRRAC